jgi:glutathione-regulated potassium-efflux system ancillary protein KefC
MSARSVLEVLGLEPHAARKLAWRFRQHSVEQLERMVPLQKDQDAVIAASRQARQQFEELIAQERQDAEAQQQQRRGWAQASEP